MKYLIFEYFIIPIHRFYLLLCFHESNHTENKKKKEEKIFISRKRVIK